MNMNVASMVHVLKGNAKHVAHALRKKDFSEENKI